MITLKSNPNFFFFFCPSCCHPTEGQIISVRRVVEGELVELDECKTTSFGEALDVFRGISSGIGCTGENSI